MPRGRFTFAGRGLRRNQVEVRAIGIKAARCNEHIYLRFAIARIYNEHSEEIRINYALYWGSRMAAHPVGHYKVLLISLPWKASGSHINVYKRPQGSHQGVAWARADAQRGRKEDLDMVASSSLTHSTASRRRSNEVTEWRMYQ
jgi:hypothetical protein